MVTQRSRTGCLTCRQRKLKCDESKPVCAQCKRANRECRPSDSVVFRHQQNASLNGAGTRSSGSGSLSSFYNYRNTYHGGNHYWVDVPRQLRFIQVTSAMAMGGDGEIDPELAEQIQPSSNEQSEDWGPDAAYRTSTSQVALHGLEALSDAAFQDQYSHMTPRSTSDQGMMSNGPAYMPHYSQNTPRSPRSVSDLGLTIGPTGPTYMPYNPQDAPNSPDSARQAMPALPSDHGVMSNASHYYNPSQSSNAAARRAMPPPPLPSATYQSANNNINFLLNPANNLSPVIDPSLQSPMEQHPPPSKVPATRRKPKKDNSPRRKTNKDEELASLLRGVAGDNTLQEQVVSSGHVD